LLEPWREAEFTNGTVEADVLREPPGSAGLESADSLPPFIEPLDRTHPTRVAQQRFESDRRLREPGPLTLVERLNSKRDDGYVPIAVADAHG
jgi:hypothetical protein